ncbi:ATP-binding protein [Amycolatopsis sp. cmx-8-4]|uniref:ATP-binding protein n=1 Tax=Amycolatopsis sp. cmx-8-4 TaxID=2790947 RepID=UPI003978FBA7
MSAIPTLLRSQYESYARGSPLPKSAAHDRTRNRPSPPGASQWRQVIEDALGDTAALARPCQRTAPAGTPGPAIPAADHERIFDRFTRLDDARTGDTGSTGLGLSIARRIAAAHHGTFSVDEIDRSARFTVRIPLTTADIPGRTDQLEGL